MRLCARISGSPSAAEDLAQETLLQAWRLRERQREPEPAPVWLAAIARNVCLRWRRTRGHDLAHLGAPLPEPVDRFDIEAELDRSELAELLDRAMALLPPATRSVLVQRLVQESPHAAIAARLGVSEGAVTMRVQRGKVLLRRILTTRFRAQAASFGLADVAGPEWEQTRIWCPECGARRLWGRWTEGRCLWLECWGCHCVPRLPIIYGWFGQLYWGRTCAELLAGVSGFKPAATRLAAANHTAYCTGVAGVTAKCARCLHPNPAFMGGSGDVRVRCRRCGLDNGISATGGVAFSHPAMQAFWRRHGRIRALPALHVEAAGLPAVVCRTESVADSATLAVVLGRDTLVPLGVRGEDPRRRRRGTVNEGAGDQ